MTIYDLFTTTAVCIAGLLIWQHMNVSRLARRAALIQCQKHQLLLLDQSIILQGIRLRLNKGVLVGLERRYGFEFSTQSDQRYLGKLVFLGSTLTFSELQAYKL